MNEKSMSVAVYSGPVEIEPFSLDVCLDDHEKKTLFQGFSSIAFYRGDEVIKIPNEYLFKKLKELFPEFVK